MPISAVDRSPGGHKGRICIRAALGARPVRPVNTRNPVESTDGLGQGKDPVHAGRIPNQRGWREYGMVVRCDVSKPFAEKEQSQRTNPAAAAAVPAIDRFHPIDAVCQQQCGGGRAKAVHQTAQQGERPAQYAPQSHRPIRRPRSAAAAREAQARSACALCPWPPCPLCP